MRTIHDVLPPDRARDIITFKQAVERELPGRVTRVILFGSRARGDAHEESDYDVAVYVRGLDRANRSAVRDTLSNAAYDYVLKGVYIRPLPISDENPRSSGSELADNIARDGVVVP